MAKRTNMLRSKIGTHFAGSGMTHAFYESDENPKLNSQAEFRSGCSFGYETLMKDKDKWDAYCKEQSGEVRTYTLEELAKQDVQRSAGAVVQNKRHSEED